MIFEDKLIKGSILKTNYTVYYDDIVKLLCDDENTNKKIFFDTIAYIVHEKKNVIVKKKKNNGTYYKHMTKKELYTELKKMKIFNIFMDYENKLSSYCTTSYRPYNKDFLHRINSVSFNTFPGFKVWELKKKNNGS